MRTKVSVIFFLIKKSRLYIIILVVNRTHIDVAVTTSMWLVEPIKYDRRLIDLEYKPKSNNKTNK